MSHKKSDDAPHPSISLRARAEELVRTRCTDLSEMKAEDVHALVHELEVHQIELELQNEELRQSQVELAHSRDQYSELFEFAPTGYVTLDRNGKIHNANLTAAKLLGIDRQTLLHANLSNFVVRGSQYDFYFHRQSVFGGEQKQVCELPMKKTGGRDLFVRLESIAFGVENDRHCRTSLIDITQQKMAENALQQLNKELKQRVAEQTSEIRLLAEAIAHLGEGVLITTSGLDLPGPQTVFVNEAMSSITGYTYDELIGQSPRLFQGEDTDRDTLVRIKAELSAGRSVVAELINYRKDGTPYDVEMYITPLFNFDNRLTHFVSIQRDTTERKQAERILSERNKLLRVATDNAAVGIVLVDRRHHYIFANPAYCKILGLPLTAQDLIERGPAEVLPDVYTSQIAPRLDRAFAGERVSYELTRSSSVYAVVYDPIHDESERVDRVIVTIFDITDRKRAAEILQQSESRLAAEAAALTRLNEASSRLWRMTDLQVGLEETLTATIELLGGDKGNIQLFDANRNVLTIQAHFGFEQSFLDFFREVCAADDSACGRALRCGERTVIEDVETDPLYAPYREIARAAGYRGVQSTPLIGRDGQPLGVISTYFHMPHVPGELELRRLDLYARQAADFIERCRREKALLERKERLLAVLNTASDAIITIDTRGKITDVNPATEVMFGYTRSELIGQNVKILMPQPYFDEHDRYIAQYLQTGKPHIIGIGREVTAKRKDSSIFPVDLAVSEVDHLGLFTGVIRDISERKKLQRDILAAVEDEKRRIGQELHDGCQQELAGLGMVSHSLLGNLTQSSDALPGAYKEKCCELAKKIVKGIDRALLDVQATAKGLVPVSLGKQGLVSALRMLAKKTDELDQVVCAFKNEQPVNISCADTQLHLYRIAQEAVANALKHSHAEHILIALSCENSHPVLQIADDGIGFDSTKRLEGLGMKTMAYRASLIGGQLTVAPLETGGTIVTCTILGGRSNADS